MCSSTNFERMLPNLWKESLEAFLGKNANPYKKLPEWSENDWLTSVHNGYDSFIS